MAIIADKINIKDIKWVQWESRKQAKLIAYAVDPTSKARTGVLRSLNGSTIPKRAEPAKPSTKRDPFCVKIVSQLEKGTLHKGRSVKASTTSKRGDIKRKPKKTKAAPVAQAAKTATTRKPRSDKGVKRAPKADPTAAE